MKLRRSVVLCIALVSVIALWGRASAAVSRVGGGASTFEATIHSAGSLGSLQPVVVSDPNAVALPEGGSSTPITGSLLGLVPPVLAIQGVSFQAGYVSTVGTLEGPVHAQSSATVTGISISGSSIRTVHTECLWYERTSSGSTTVVDALGQSFMPRPNTRVDIPGGYIILNEQEKRTDTVTGAEVITVKGAHVYMLRGGLGIQSVSVDVALAFSSCDPIRIPSLTGFDF
jgi:hypothetical protein